MTTGPLLVTRHVQTGAAWAWRYLVILAAVGITFYMLLYLAEVTIPLAVATLLSALLTPAKNVLVRRGLPNKWAAPIVFIVGLLIVLGLISLMIQQFIAGAPGLAAQASDGLDQIRHWLSRGPLHITSDQISSTLDSAKEWLGKNQSELTHGAVNAATTAGTIGAGGLISLFTLFFFLRDGDRIWRWLLQMTPERSRARLDSSARHAWVTLAGYIKGTAAVAVVDAAGIAIVLLIVGVPLVFPLAALVFLTAFVPIIGATIAGVVSVLVALVTVGPIGALIVLGGVILVQQLESHILQPFLMGRALKMHPLAVVLAITAGVVVYGILGALFSVPLAAAANAAIKSWRGVADAPDDPQPPSDRDDHAPSEDAPE